MLETGTHLLSVPALQKSVRVAPIASFLRALHDASRVAKRVMGTKTYYVLGMLKCAKVDATWLDDALAQTRAATCDQLEATWTRLGFRSQHQGQWRQFFQPLKKIWMSHALVIVRATEGSPPYVQCCCPMSCGYGHCVHEYAVQVLHGLKPTWGYEVPKAKVGAALLRQQPSPSSSSSSSSSSSTSGGSSCPSTPQPSDHGDAPLISLGARGRGRARSKARGSRRARGAGR